MGKTVRAERSGWRDRALSLRHRDWGWDCPAVDIDFLMLEYDNSKPAALVEYKHERAKQAKSTHPSYKAMRALCDSSQIPLLAVRYTQDLSSYLVVPLNAKASVFIPNRRPMTELEYVTLLYAIRNRTLPPEIAEALSVAPELDPPTEREDELIVELERAQNRQRELEQLLTQKEEHIRELLLEIKHRHKKPQKKATRPTEPQAPLFNSST